MANSHHNPAEEAAAGAHTEISHEHHIYAQELFNVGGFPITNSMLNTWIVVVLLVVVSLIVKRRIKTVPRGLQNMFEIIIEKFLDIFDSVTGSRERSMKFFPLVFSFFLFILVSNWLGLLPGIGSVGQVVAEDGHKAFVPYFRGATADLNTTLALAIIGVVASHIFGLFAIGAWRHLNKFINLKAIGQMFTRVKQDPSVLIVNPVQVFVGFIEIVGELAKVASLSFRLFGNIFAGEVLLASMAAILAFGLPIPFMFLEVLVGLIQALIFAMLVLAYLTINTSAEEH